MSTDETHATHMSLYFERVRHERELQAKVAEYERLQAALDCFETLDATTDITIKGLRFFVTIEGNEDDEDAYYVVSVHGSSLIDACEKAVKALKGKR